MPPRLSVVICSLNGADGVDRCIRALGCQTIYAAIELIVVDDGSTDATAEVGEAHGTIVVRHGANLGLAAARNSGVAVATAPTVAFLDDDCEPEPRWAESLLSGYEEGVIGVSGPILPSARSGFMLGYLQRHNPLAPQEANLSKSNKIWYRLCLYLQRQWAVGENFARRDVYSFAGANMSFDRQILLEVGGFDERFRFGAEELDVCMRLGRVFPSGRLVFLPGAQVIHHFRPFLCDALRRSRAYGRGSARLYRKWPAVPPTFFPGPLVVLAFVIMSLSIPLLGLAALLIPLALYPQGIRHALRRRSGGSLLDGYVQLAQETFGNIGFVEGLWRFRRFVPEVGSGAFESGKVVEGRR